MLLASQFESPVHPLTILLSVPLSVIGVILALFLTEGFFGLTAFIGLLLLVGIVVKNGIPLIDYTNLLRERGRTRDEAVLEASPTRLRPILMTSLAAGSVRRRSRSAWERVRRHRPAGDIGGRRADDLDTADSSWYHASTRCSTTRAAPPRRR